MTSLEFKCVLQTDLVLNASPASEGVNESLAYIPGVKFLGLAAHSLYDEQSVTKTLHIFHDATVRFGDAHPFVEGGDTYLVPANWYFPKDKKEGPFYLHQNLSVDDIRALADEKNIQLKRAKDYYILVIEGENELQQIKVPQKFTLKTGFDSSRRRSRDGQLFGYYAISAGTSWKFTVDVDDDSLIDAVTDAIKGPQRIGRSKSAQYGAVEISLIGRKPLDQSTVPAGEVYLYAVSNLCFYDKAGRPTIQPDAESLHLPTGSKIEWGKSRLQHRRYTSWNGKRQTKNADRYIIERGSVICATIPAELPASTWSKGVGAYRNEGFGRLLVNPLFLRADSADPKLLAAPVVLPAKKDDSYMKVVDLEPLVAADKSDTAIMRYAQRAAEERMADVEILRRVNEFIENNLDEGLHLVDVKNSQWGQIRQLVRRTPTYPELKRLLFDSEVGQLLKGETQSVWKRNNRAARLKIEAEVLVGHELAFLEKLATELPKWKSN